MPNSRPIDRPAQKLCPCGSGQPRRDLIDLQGIFCAYVCDACEAEKKAEFKPDIFFGPYPNDELLDDD